MENPRMCRWFMAFTLFLAVQFVVAPDRLVAAQPTLTLQNVTINHKVTKGETLWQIAKRYGVNVQDIVTWNRLPDPERLEIGQSLTVILPEPNQPEIYSTDKNTELLARLIYAEARGEDFTGQVAVGAVVLNRLKHPKFPKTLQDVIYQPGAFTAIRDRQIRLEPDQKAWQAAKAALNGEDPTGGALFYYNPVTAKDQWIRTRPVLKVIGNHTFSS